MSTTVVGGTHVGELGLKGGGLKPQVDFIQSIREFIFWGLRRITWVRCLITRTRHMWQKMAFPQQHMKNNSWSKFPPTHFTWQNTKTYSKNKSVFWRNWDHNTLVFCWGVGWEEFSYKHSEILLYDSILELCSDNWKPVAELYISSIP